LDFNAYQFYLHPSKTQTIDNTAELNQAKDSFLNYNAFKTPDESFLSTAIFLHLLNFSFKFASAWYNIYIPNSKP